MRTHSSTAAPTSAVRTSATSTAARRLSAGLAVAGLAAAAAVATAGTASAQATDPAPSAPAGSSLGYGSLGTGSLSDTFSELVRSGSVALSVQLPLDTGVLLPGSTGSYGPEAAIGQFSATSTGSLIKGSIGQ